MPLFCFCFFRIHLRFGSPWPLARFPTEPRGIPSPNEDLIGGRDSNDQLVQAIDVSIVTKKLVCAAQLEVNRDVFALSLSFLSSLLLL